MIDNPPPPPPSPEPLLTLKRKVNPHKESIPQESRPEHPRGRQGGSGGHIPHPAVRHVARSGSARIHEHAY